MYACTQQLLSLLLQLLDASVHCDPLVVQVQSMCVLCGSEIKYCPVIQRELYCLTGEIEFMVKCIIIAISKYETLVCR